MVFSREFSRHGCVTDTSRRTMIEAASRMLIMREYKLSQFIVKSNLSLVDEYNLTAAKVMIGDFAILYSVV